MNGGHICVSQTSDSGFSLLVNWQLMGTKKLRGGKMDFSESTHAAKKLALPTSSFPSLLRNLSLCTSCCKLNVTGFNGKLSSFVREAARLRKENLESWGWDSRSSREIWSTHFKHKVALLSHIKRSKRREPPISFLSDRRKMHLKTWLTFVTWWRAIGGGLRSAWSCPPSWLRPQSDFALHTPM